MHELVDKIQKEKFNYPGVFDRSAKKAEVLPPVPTSDDKKEGEVEAPVKKMRAPPKAKTAEVSTSGKKPLKLGKIKG